MVSLHVQEWAGETTSYQREVIEHALAHQLANKAETFLYQRGTLWLKHVSLMDEWSSYCWRFADQNIG